MYKQVKTHETAILDNGVEFKPVATLESEAGGICHISIDDHCYKLTLKQEDGRFKVTPYIFGEALEVLRRLPPLILDIKTIKMDILNTELEECYTNTPIDGCVETKEYPLSRPSATGELVPELNTDFMTEKEIIENCLFRARQLHFDGNTPSDTDVKELETELYDRLFSYRDSKKETPLSRPVAYSLVDIFKELKFGRPATSQHYLDKCIKELTEPTDSVCYNSDEHLPNFKFTPPAPDELKVDIKNNLEPFGYILLKSEYKENVKSILGEMRFNNTIRYDIFYLFSPNDIELLKKENKLNEYFIPCLSYNGEKLILGNTKEFKFKKITSDGYFEALINEDKIKIKLPEGKWYMFYNSELHDENRLILYKEKIEELKPYGYSEGESYEHLFNKKDDEVYGYILTAQHYEKAALAILDIEAFLNSDGVHIRQPKNIEKLRAAGVLDNWFYAISVKDMDKFNSNKIDEMSSGGKLMVKYLNPIVEKSDKTAYSEKMPEGYILIKSEYETYVMSMIEKDGFFKNNENDVLILSPTNIEKLIQKGVLSDWLMPVLKYDSDEFIVRFPEEYNNIRVTIDGYFVMEKMISDKCHLVKFKLPVGNWEIYKVNGDNHTVTLYTENKLNKVLANELKRGFKYTFEKTLLKRIENLRDVESGMTFSESENDITKVVHKYYSGIEVATIQNVNFTIRLIKDIIEHPYFYMEPN